MDSEGLLQPIADPSLLYTPHSGKSTAIREKLADLFTATEFVRVQNVDDEPFIWQYMPDAKEHIEFDTSSSTVPQKITYRDAPEVYMLQPGEAKPVIGGCAYMMIEGLVKKMMSKKVIANQPNVKPGESRNFNFSDDQQQVEWIEKIYLGKWTPTSYSAPLPTPEPVSTRSIDEDLGLGNISPTPRRRGRQPRPAV